MKILSYGECPNCGDMCQPPDPPNEDDLEFCFCCDCEIVWDIVHTEANKKYPTWARGWAVTNIQTFDEFGMKPYGC